MTAQQKLGLKKLRNDCIKEMKAIILGEKCPVDIWNSLTQEPIINRGEKIREHMVIRMVDAHACLDMDVEMFRLHIMPMIGTYSKRVAAIVSERASQ